MSRIQKINWIYLFTVLIWILGGGILSLIYWHIGNTTLTLLLSQVILVIPALYYVLKDRMNISEVVRFKKIKVSTIILLILFAYAITPLMSLINMISMLFVKNDIQNTIEQIVYEEPLFIGLIVVALIPSIFEELIYRGVFYNEYRKVNILKGILLSALLFALMHMNFNQFFYAFIMGMIFGFIIEVTDSILATIIIHFVINASSTWMAYMLPKLQDMLIQLDPTYAASISQSMNMEISRTELLIMISSYAPVAAIFGLVGIWLFVMIGKNTGRLSHVKEIFYENSQVEKSAEKRFFSWPLIGSIVICVALMLVNEL